MLIYLIKFIHLIFTLSLLGSTVYCFALSRFIPSSIEKITRVNKTIFLQIIMTVITGTLLIYPKHFTMHTPWIQAAYLFVFIFSLCIFLLVLFKDKIKSRWVGLSTYLFLFLILIAIVHGAVTKTTLSF